MLKNSIRILNVKAMMNIRVGLIKSCFDKGGNVW